MDPPASPPKRITRARAAARAATASTASSAAKASSKVLAATATSKSKTSRSAAPASVSSTVAAPTRTSTKRKTRSDDNEDDSDIETVAKRPPPASRTATRATRGPGRPKKTADPEPRPESAPARPTRGRPAKKPATESVKEEAPTTAIRTRTKKTHVSGDEDADVLASEPARKPIRARPAGTATTASAPASKPVKKTVTFAEPDKENVVPGTGAKGKNAATKPAETTVTGMRAKPVRKPAGAAGRTTRTASTKKNTKETEDKKAPMPLSPKKVTQLPVNKDRDGDSEDELAMDRTPARPLHRSPIKPPASMKPHTQVHEDTPAAYEEMASLVSKDPTVLLGSPVRRPPPSPFKGAIKSPAKRVEGLQLGLAVVKESSESGLSPFKASLMQSPAKRPPMPIKPVELEGPGREDQNIDALFKQSLFQSPAKRGFSPLKSLKMPEESTVAESPAPTPVLLCAPFEAPSTDEEEGSAAADGADEPNEAALDEELNEGVVAPSPSKSKFNGRMSTVLPREADPALSHMSLVHEPAEEEGCEIVVHEEDQTSVADPGDPMILDDLELQAESVVAVADESVSTTPPDSPPQQTLDLFGGLRQKDMVPFDTSYSESEDELTRVMTPKTVSPTKHMNGSIMKPRTSGLGFTPLARRFDEWQPRSPLKAESRSKTPKAEKSPEARENAKEPRDSLMKNTFFEDEMCVRPDAAANDSINEVDSLAGIPEIKDPVCEDISITDEDLDLAAEANEMSVMSPEQVESMLNLDGNDDSISEASQEYGDENAVPGNGSLVPPVTPQRFIRREFHTVSKVPLKPADESTPPAQPSLKKRRHSISRLPVASDRPADRLSRSATVISYSPSQRRHVDAAFEEAAEEISQERAGSVPPVTPSKTETWSNAATPARTPRRDVSPTLLRGAVVLVDVYTVDGADASAIFVELLNQMGARCVKSWNWNPTDEDASAKVGITHVVYKDGGVRTMEKVRETGGVVQCVGVGWVLDCERENEWLDEAPYYIDTSLIPRGGARRRKSMEPKALSNLNGTLVPNSAPRNASTARGCQTAPTTPAPANRRDSGLWMRSPDDFEGFDDEQENNDFENGHEDWYNAAPLTPVPKTPAPEAIHRFAMEVMADDDVESAMTEAAEDEELSREQLIQRTCPPKAQHVYHNLGAGILGRDKDESVARRLMDARRKSLAFAPKVSSPLAKSWKEWN